MSAALTDFEALLREALAPIEPPDDLLARLETRLVSLTELAQDELEAWELSAMRDPRNWARPAAAVVVGAGAGTALVALRVRSRHRARTQRARRPDRARRAHHPGHRRGSAASPARPLTGRRPLGGRASADSVIGPMATCYRHPSRETGVACSSCGRPICPDCMTPTSVGMRCPECARERTKVRTVSSGPTVPVVTRALIALNVLVFFAETATGGQLGGGGRGDRIRQGLPVRTVRRPAA